MTTSARVAVTEAKDAPFLWREVTLEDPRPDEVLVRIVATGICATDAHVRSQHIATPLPIVLGHEGAGVVERVGSEVTSVATGDHVVLSFHSCGTCRQCLAGHPAYCDSAREANFGGARLDGTNALHAIDAHPDPYGHFFGQSSFATHALANARNTVRVPADLPLEVLAPLGCGMQTGAGTVLSGFRMPAGSSLLVVGVGAVGLAAVMGAKVAGAATVIAVDVDEQRLQLARDLGASHAIDARQVADVSRAVHAIRAQGVEFAIETSGRQASLDSALQSLAPMGRLASVTFGQGAPLTVDAGLLTLGRQAQGVIQGDAIPQLMIDTLASLYRAGRFPVDELITFYAADDIDRAFTDASSGRVTKAVLRF